MLGVKTKLCVFLGINYYVTKKIDSDYFSGEFKSELINATKTTMKDNQLLGRLIKVDLREAWVSEPQDFTPWLAEEHNLRLLADTLGMDELELVKTEHGVGPFSADILCKNTLDDSFVLIENQLERTDHKHLGQLLTYAAGLEAVTIIWIAEKITEEHRAALDWLNQITPEKYSFFGLEIELWKIGTSIPAPKFNIVSEPNDWSKSTITAATVGKLSDTKKLQLEFWTQFKEYMSHMSKITCQKPASQHWMNHSIGKTGMNLASIISTYDSEKGSYDPEIRVELYLNSVDAKGYYSILQNDRNNIDAEIGNQVTWYNPENKKSCKIYVKKKIDFQEKENWETCFLWLKENLEKFTTVFSQRIRALN